MMSAVNAGAGALGPAPALGAVPPAPGALGTEVDPAALLRYLDDQREWNQALSANLVELDAAQAMSDHPQVMLADVTLAWSLSAAIDRHYERVVRAWDSGRITRRDTVAIVNLLWERLDSSLNSSLAVSFVEACTLAEALIHRLDARLESNGDLLARRLDAALSKAESVQTLAARCREKILRPPNVAVPDPAALGAVPSERSLRAEFDVRLSSVEAALVIAEDAYASALGAREELRQVLGAYTDMAAKQGVGEHQLVAPAEASARSALWTAPCDVDASRELVTRYRQAIATATRGGQ